MMVATCLFLGGASDGVWRDVDPDRSHWVVSADRPVKLLPDDEAVFAAESYQLVYRRMPLAVAGRVVTNAFVLSGIPDEEAFRMLLRGYRQGVPVHPPAAYEEGFRNGWRAGIDQAIRIIASDNAVSPSPAWEVFRDRIKGLLKSCLSGGAPC